MNSKAVAFASSRRKARDGGEIAAPPRPFAGLSATAGANGEPDWRAAQVQEWLLLLLRFAITRDPKDEAAAQAMAHDIDSLALQGQATPRFFRKTSSEVCAAIAAPDADPNRTAILKGHLARIEDIRLRQAFQAAVDLEGRSRRVSAKAKRGDLWSGLRRKRGFSGKPAR